MARHAAAQVVAQVVGRAVAPVAEVPAGRVAALVVKEAFKVQAVDREVFRGPVGSLKRKKPRLCRLLKSPSK